MRDKHGWERDAGKVLLRVGREIGNLIEQEAKTMEAKYTSGPWETSSNGEGQWDVCGPDAGDMIADLAGCENQEANARLIAAAPDLLAALETIAQGPDEFEHSQDIWDELQACREVARQTIARAKGEA